ncbi:transporter [Phenylobacterium deserti]|uniref:Transporter n=2 Tax=Phenylobacterium deserti TaxID=1914756 RepID=A0A328ATN2_9CAUL|nr:transporter [Phenylobacterium deserti]
MALAGSIVLGLGAAGAAQAQVAPAAAPAASQDAVSPSQFNELKAELTRQSQLIEAQRKELDELKAQRDEMLNAIRAAGIGRATSMAALQQQVPNPVSEAPPVQPVAPTAPTPSGVPQVGPARPVGQAPPEQARADADAIPPGLGVLTPRGHFVFDPSVEYVRTSNNRLIFRGVQIVQGILVGAIDAGDVGRDTGVVTLAGRYGLTNRLEVEARVPYVWRHDSIQNVSAADNAVQRTSELRGQDIGDVEVGARYQLNYGRNGWPIFVANTRVKTPTGTGPYEVEYDRDGVAQELSTGSGFWSAEAGVTMLYPTDPAIIFGGISYLHTWGRDIDRRIPNGDSDPIFLGRIEPGASISGSLGFGLSLNPRFSVSLGYGHSYIQPTKTIVNGEENESRALQVGSMMMGWSFRLTPRLTLNNAFEFGVTSDAPDMRVVFRAPYRF